MYVISFDFIESYSRNKRSIYIISYMIFIFPGYENMKQEHATKQGVMMRLLHIPYRYVRLPAWTHNLFSRLANIHVPCTRLSICYAVDVPADRPKFWNWSGLRRRCRAGCGRDFPLLLLLTSTTRHPIEKLSSTMENLIHLIHLIKSLNFLILIF
jgi:hypothetical protein